MHRKWLLKCREGDVSNPLWLQPTNGPQRAAQSFAAVGNQRGLRPPALHFNPTCQARFL